MCDTMVALSSATAEGVTLFGKNSDREPDEVQNLEVVEAADHPAGAEVRCTYLTIPQAARTARVLLCRPFWMFGAEMGANEFGVVIGNEALFTREKPQPPGLTGMDLLRLALERSQSAAEARDEIIALLEAHGQGGNCGYRMKADYMNGFLIADAQEAYVLETVGRWWAWKKVKDRWSISNIISITDDFDACAPGLIENAVKKGWAKSQADFNFRRCYSDRLITKGARGAEREACSRRRLKERKGRLTAADMMAALRDHGADPAWRPDRQTTAGVCMHAQNPLFGRSQTTGSLVASLGPHRRDFFATGAANPCLSPFFPVFGPTAGLPADYSPGGAAYDPASYWWRCEVIHRRLLDRFAAAHEDLAPRLRDFEAETVAALERQGSPDQAALDAAFREARELVRRGETRADALARRKTRVLYRLYWRVYQWLDRLPG
jgi:secernin